jgi:hypothetical protein
MREGERRSAARKPAAEPPERHCEGAQRRSNDGWPFRHWIIAFEETDGRLALSKEAAQ